MRANEGNAHKGNTPYSVVWVAVIVVRSSNSNKQVQSGIPGAMMESFTVCLPSCFLLPPMIPFFSIKPLPVLSASEA